MQVRDRAAEIAEASAEVLVISFSSLELIAPLREALELPFTVAEDGDRSAYRAYGLLSGSRWQVWRPTVLWQYVKLVACGAKLRAPQGGDDLYQLGGDFVIDPTGLLRYAYVSKGPEDRPAVDELLAALPTAADP